MRQRLVIRRTDENVNYNYLLLLNQYDDDDNLIVSGTLDVFATNETAKKYALYEAKDRKAVGIIYANGKELVL